MPSPLNASEYAAPPPLVAALDMGYGHLRPATALADALGVEVMRTDREPLAGAEEVRLWGRIRGIYEATTRWTGLPVVGRTLSRVVESLTDIPHLHPHRDQSAASFAVRRFDALIRDGLGRRLAEHLQASGRALLTTHFAPALAADAAGCAPVWCVVTDSDINRIWAPRAAHRTRIGYLVPSMRALRRLRAYGVPRANIHVTGFPLPGELLGGEDLGTLRRSVAARIVRLDPRGTLREAYREELRYFFGELPEGEQDVPPRITFAIGGAGAQTEIVEQFLPTLAPEIAAGRWRLALVAGVRRPLADHLRSLVARVGLDERPDGPVEVLCADRHEDYFRSFNALLARTDVLWSKPSEITFFGALGLALVLGPPVGVHEAYNRRWARDHGAGLKQRDARYAAQWLREWLDDGVLAGAAWSGFMRLPKYGLYRILKLVHGTRAGGG